MKFLDDFYEFLRKNYKVFLAFEVMKSILL